MSGEDEAVAESRSPMAMRRCAMMDSSMLTCSASWSVEELDDDEVADDRMAACCRVRAWRAMRWEGMS